MLLITIGTALAVKVKTTDPPLRGLPCGLPPWTTYTLSKQPHLL